ncbi:MAG: L-rhamnose isomerase, partial [Parvularcula sp.]|nr:L-rhamnose isomerase [Parvularcula sp.]
MPTHTPTNDARFRDASEQFAELDVDVEEALETLARTPLSVPCWQADDVAGFEALENGDTGGLAVTGSYPGRARNPEELRGDFDLLAR